MILAFFWLLLCSLSAASKIAVFGPKNSGKTAFLQKLCPHTVIQPYQEYEIRPNLSIFEVEGYDAVGSHNMSSRLQEAGLSIESVGLVLMLEDTTIEYSRVLNTQQALSRVLPLPACKILGLVTKSDEDEFGITEDRVRIFRQRGLRAVVVGSETTREEILEAIAPFFETETAKPLSLPILQTPCDQLIAALSGWTRTQVRSSVLSVSNSAFSFDGAGADWTMYCRENESVLVDTSRKVIAMISNNGLHLRQEIPLDLNLSSDIPIMISGEFGVLSSNSPVTVVGMANFVAISSPNITVSEESRVQIKRAECKGKPIYVCI